VYKRQRGLGDVYKRQRKDKSELSFLAEWLPQINPNLQLEEERVAMHNL
jgi:hypothetical protein